jgi:predicted RNA-binding protein with TRAM domain
MSFGQRRTGFGGNRGGSFGSVKKPVEVGKEYNVTISDTSKRGEGIAKIDGFVIFVPGTRMGQQARIKVTSVSERFASGQVVENAAADTGSAATTTSAPAESTQDTS